MMKKIKDYSFIAYIDETGDVGIKPDKSGSSDWFGLSAFIVNVDTDLNLVKIRNDIVERYSTSPRPLSKENKIIHMRKLKSYEARLFVAKSVAEVGASCIMVL